MSHVQIFPALDAATEAALRASIERFGVLVAVYKDQHGRILDGHHRVRIADELGVRYLTVIRPVADEAEAREIARTLNADRRHLTIKQRQPIVVALKGDGHSNVAIAKALGVSEKTIRTDIAGSDISEPVTNLAQGLVIGLDGKTYPAKRSKPAQANGAAVRRGIRGAANREKPFHVDTRRKEELATGQYGRISVGLSEISGVVRGLRDVDVHMAAAADTADLKTWASKATSLGRELHAFATRLREADSNGS